METKNTAFEIKKYLDKQNAIDVIMHYFTKTESSERLTLDAMREALGEIFDEAVWFAEVRWKSSR